MTAFTIDWLQINTGRKFTANYIFDGCSTQKGYDLIGWCLRCLRFGQKQGFRAGVKNIKLKNPI